MFTRRDLLRFAGAVPALQALPASISNLKSRRSEARPISSGERLGRMERARQLTRENRLDAICLSSGTSLVYFTGIRWGGGERFFGMVLPAKGEPFYVSPAFEEDRAREQIENAPEGARARLLTWQEDESPYALVARGIRERGLATGKLGIEETMKFVFAEGIGKAAPAIAVASATPVTAGCRMIKSPQEIALMRLAAEVTVEAYAAAWRALRDGMTRQEFTDLIAAAHRQLGFPGGAFTLVDEFTARPHGTTKPQTIREGSIVLIDGDCSVEGYTSDITRTFVLGKPTGKMKRVFEIVRKAQSAALAAARPGVPCEEIDRAARKVIVDAGYGPGYKFFTHRIGHGMGMDVHEWPYLVRGNKLPLAAHMTFSDEPGIYIRGEFGVRLEDGMHVTENGAELFTRQSASLEDPFGS